MTARYSRSGVPLSGQRAAREGWTEDANPHRKGSLSYVRWAAAWGKAEAAMYQQHLTNDAVYRQHLEKKK